jgi:nitrogen regulatory protein P-II 2
VNFVPKVKIEVAVRSDQVDKVVEAISGPCKTGQIGGSKIFAFGLEQAVRTPAKSTTPFDPAIPGKG